MYLTKSLKLFKKHSTSFKDLQVSFFKHFKSNFFFCGFGGLGGFGGGGGGLGGNGSGGGGGLGGCGIGGIGGLHGFEDIFL